MADTVVEREREFQAVDEAIRHLGAGDGGILVIEAASGLGKTTLLRHARDRATGAGLTVLCARGAELETDFAFGVVRQLFEPALPAEPEHRRRLFDGTAVEPLFAAETTNGAPDAAPLYALLTGLHRLLVTLTRNHPVVIVVDDVQWADRPSLRFLGFLVRRLDALPVALIVAIRSGEPDEEGLRDDILTAYRTVLLEPKPLSAPAVAGLVRQALGADADREFCAACHAVTGGNPLFVRELLRILVADGARPDRSGAAAVIAAGPDAVRRHLLARLRRQPADLWRVVRAIAVLGNDTAIALVARQSGLAVATTMAAAEQLRGQGFLCGVDPPTFVHGTVQEAVLSLMPLAERSAAHARAASMLTEAAAPVARVASHLLRTNPDANPDWVDTLLTAARQAKNHGAPANAAVYLRRALLEPPAPALRSEIHRLLGNCEAHALALPDAEKHLRQALALAEGPPQRALCGYSLARVLNAMGATTEAIALLKAAAAEPQPPEHAGLAIEVEAELVGTARNDLSSRQLLVEHLAALRRRPGHPEAAVDAHESLELVFAGEAADRAGAVAWRALSDDRLEPDRPAIWIAMRTMFVTDRLDDAEQRLYRALRAAERRGLLFTFQLALAYLARVAFLRGDLTTARAHIARGLAEPHATFALPALQATAVQLLIEDGRLAEAERAVSESELAGSASPTTCLQLWLLDARTRLHVAGGRAEAALADAAASERAYRRWGGTRMLEVPWRLRAALAHRELDEPEQAEELVTEELRIAQAFGVPRHVGVALRVAAALASEPAESIRLLRESARSLRLSAGRLELAGTLADLAEHLLRDGRSDEGRRVAGAAVELAAECQAGALVRRTDALRGGGAGPTRLTPSELKVAELAATGLFNREIAARLYVSEKTVETHLSRVYRKLGVRSRTQLVTHLTTAG